MATPVQIQETQEQIKMNWRKWAAMREAHGVFYATLKGLHESDIASKRLSEDQFFTAGERAQLRLACDTIDEAGQKLEFGIKAFEVVMDKLYERANRAVDSAVQG